MIPTSDLNLTELRKTTKCSKDFKCFTSGFKDICNAEDIALNAYVKCKEKNPVFCKFSLFFGTEYYCDCPIRVYLAKEYGM